MAFEYLKNCQITVNSVVVKNTTKTKNLKGAYLIAPYGYLNWYFANLGLSFLVKTLSLSDIQTLVLPHIKAYITNLNSDGTIFDIEFPDWNYTTNQPTTCKTATITRDSDDSYAASFLMLVGNTFDRLLVLGGDVSYLVNNINIIKSVADKNIVNQIKANGLTSVYRIDLPIPSHLSKLPVNEAEAIRTVGYNMDNWECVGGLLALDNMLSKQQFFTNYTGNYLQVAKNISTSAHNVLLQNAWLSSDADTEVDYEHYPGATTQIFPLLFGGSLSPFPTETPDVFKHFCRCVEDVTGWYMQDSPWLLVSIYFDKLHQVDGGFYNVFQPFIKDHLKSIEEWIGANVGRVTVNELGFYYYLKNLGY